MDRYLLKCSKDDEVQELACKEDIGSLDMGANNCAQKQTLVEMVNEESLGSEAEEEQNFVKKKKKYVPDVNKNLDKFLWLDPSKKFPYCKLCLVKVSGGKFHFKRHESSSNHQKQERAARSTPQITALLKDAKKEKAYLLIKEAELKLCCYICEHNLALLLLDTLPTFNKSLYPDSDIAKRVQLKRGKATKLIVEVLGPAFKEEIANDLKDNYFSLIIDETTDTSSKKSLVVIVRYWKSKKIQDKFLDLVEIESSTAENIFSKIQTLLRINNIPFCNVIGFSADNASAMMGVLKGVQAKFREVLPYIYVQGCACHSLHLCTSAAAKKLPSTVEQFTRDIYSYFAHSSKRIGELKECQVFAEEKPHKMLYPSQTRWLSLKSVVERILEHWNSLILFFQRAAIEDNLPNDKTILTALNNPIYKLYLLFLSYVLELVVKVNIELQSETPKLPILLNRLTSLYKTLLRCFIKKDVLAKTVINEVNVNYPGNYVVIENLYVGAKADIFIKNQTDNITKGELNNFRVRALDFYIEIAYQIKKRFNFNDEYLKYAQNFSPDVALSGEIMSIANFVNLFPNIDVDIELVNTEWQLLSDTQITGCEKTTDLNIFWQKVSDVKNALGEPMFSNLMKVVKVILCLPHSSATAERVFSQLNLIKTAIRNRLNITTCSAILQIKDTMKDLQTGSMEWKPHKKILNYNYSS